MANKIINHTWEARQISQFSEPMIFPKATKMNEKDETGSCESFDMNDIEKKMTLWLQNNYCYSEEYNKRKRKRRNNIKITRTNDGEDDTLEINDDKTQNKNTESDANEIKINHTGGAYVSLSWIPIFPLSSAAYTDKSGNLSPLGLNSSMKRNSMSKSMPQREYSNSRQYISFNTSPYHYPDYHHLHIEIWIQDELKSQILLCFPNHHDKPILVDDGCSCNDDNYQNPKRQHTFYDDKRNLSNHNMKTIQKLNSKQYLTISSFSFLLVRGSNDVSHKIFQYLELMYGCMVVVPKKDIINTSISSCNHTENDNVENPELNPVRFSPFEIASTLSDWTVTNYQYYRRTCDPDTFSSEKTISTSSKSSSSLSSSATSKFNMYKIRPMEVTFALPSDISKKGLESITLTIPPLALMNLCNAIQKQSFKSKKRQRNKCEQEQNNISIQRQSTDKSNTNIDDEDDSKSLFNFPENNDIPILQAIQCYMMETFHIDIRSFQLIRATCGIASLGCDGRCKPMNALFLHDFLVSIHSMVSNRTNGL